MKQILTLSLAFWSAGLLQQLSAQPLQLIDVKPLNEILDNLDVQLDHSENLLLTARVMGKTDLDPGPDSLFYTSLANSNDFFIQKLDQDGQLLWNRTFGSEEYDNSWSSLEDENGDIYITATFKGSLDADPGPGVYMVESHAHDGLQYIDFLIIKLDADGNFIWAKNYDSWTRYQAYPGINNIKSDGNGHLYLTGNFGNDGPVVFSETFGYSHGDEDVFVMKIDIDGNTEWIKTLGGNGLDKSYGLDFTPAGEIVVTGTYRSNVDFDPGPGNTSLFAPQNVVGMFILKLDSDGNFVWVKSSEAGIVSYNKILIDGEGNMYVAGIFRGTTDFDPGPAVHNLSIPLNTLGSYLLKLDKDGAYQWSKSFKSLGTKMALDQNNNLLIGGSFRGTVDFDPSFSGSTLVTATGEDDLYVSKLTKDGVFIWVTTWGSTGIDYFRMLRLNNAGDILLHVNIAGTADIDPGSGETLITDDENILLKFHDSTTPVFENNTLEVAHVFPNPTTGTTFIQLPESCEGNVYAELRDISGKVVLSQTLNSSTSPKIHFEGPPGIYQMFLRDNNGRQFVSRIVKE